MTPVLDSVSYLSRSPTWRRRCLVKSCLARMPLVHVMIATFMVGKTSVCRLLTAKFY